MWPFRKKQFPPRSELDLTDSWDLCQGMDTDRPIIVRINRGVQPAVRHPDFRHQVGVATPLKEPDSNGFPSPSEQGQLNQLEDQLTDLLGGHPDTIHVATISTAGMREFVFYTATPEETGAKLKALVDGWEDREIQGIVQHDPKWQVYRGFA